MKKINDFKKIAHMIKNIKVDKVYPLSILDEFQSGEVYVNDVIEPSFCLFWHYCGFAYIAGEYNEHIISEIVKFMHNPSKGHSGRLALQTEIDERLQSMILMDNNIKKKEQYLFEFSKENISSLDMKYNFKLQPINSKNYEKPKKSINHSQSTKFNCMM